MGGHQELDISEATDASHPQRGQPPERILGGQAGLCLRTLLSQPSTLGRPKDADCPLSHPRALSTYHLSVLAPRGDFARQGVHPTAKARQVPRKGDACRSDPLEGLNTEGLGWDGVRREGGGTGGWPDCLCKCSWNQRSQGLRRPQATCAIRDA